MATQHEEPSNAVADESQRLLRQQAEAQAGSISEADVARLTPTELSQMVQELRTHQIELEMQNEELRRTQESLVASQARYFDLYDFAPVGYVTLDSHHAVLEANLTATTLLGTTRQALKQRRFTHFIVGDDQDFFYLHRKQMFEQGKAQVFDLRLTRQDGDTFWARLHMAPMVGEASDSAVCRLTISDISESKRQEAATALSEHKYRFLMENLTEGIWYIDPNAETTFVNVPMAAMLGYTAEEMIGKPLFAFMDEQGVELAERNLAKRKAGVSERHEFEFLRKDGARLYASLETGPIFDERGTYIGAIASVQDITDRRQAEAALQRSQHNLAQAQRIGQLGSWEWDVQESTLFWSDQLYTIYGVDRDFSLTYASIEAMIHPEDRALNNAKVQEILATGQPVDFQFRIVRPDGTVRWLEQHIVAAAGQTGAPHRLVGVMQDITDRTRAEAERETLRTRLAEAEKLEMVGRLAGGIAHDFNNMLAVILMRAELGAQMVIADEPIHRHLAEISKAANRSAALVRQLLGFARRQMITPRVLDLNATVDGMLPMLQQLLGEEIDLGFHRGADLWPVRMDPSQIDQILVNLCVNARDAIAATGHVTITTANAEMEQEIWSTGFVITPGDYVVLSVTDDGSGMESAVLEHIFEPFYTTKPVGKGTGLGLATVYGIVKQNHGEIQVYSEPGIGSTFTIYLPRTVEGATPALSSGGRPLLLGHGESLLLVEDKAELLQSTAEALLHLGYSVTPTSQPAEAEQLVAGGSTRFDLLVSDIIMPRMDGRELAQRIAARQPGIRCLYMSGYPAAFIANRGLLDDNVHFLQKPFSLAALAAKVREALDD